MSAGGRRAVLTWPLVAVVLAVVLAFARPGPLRAQQQADTLTLGQVQRDAAAADPRRRELDLLAAQSALRLQNLGAERLPSITGQAQAQYQSDVTTVPAGLTGITIPEPSHDTYDAHAAFREAILDPSVSARESDERAQLAESQARVRTALYTLRREVNDAYFAAASLGDRLRIVRADIRDLTGRLGEAADRLREGTALPSDSAAVAAAILLRRQDELELSASRRAALMQLGALAGRAVGDSVTLALPDLAQRVAAALDSSDRLRVRPEYAQFARARERLAAQRSLISAREAPSVSAFGRAGYGRPGLNQLSRDFEGYWLAGVQVQWSPFNWGSGGRSREVLALQRAILDADEAAFRQSVDRAIQPDQAAVSRLDSALALDEQIVQLREQIERESRVRFEEGVLTAAQYLDRSTELMQSRLRLSAHLIERAHAQARLLTTLGLEVP